jgi:hypothetical protein
MHHHNLLYNFLPPLSLSLFKFVENLAEYSTWLLLPNLRSIHVVAR